MSNRKTSAQPVLARRTERGWSQAELARRAGISRTAVSAIEGDRLAPSVTTALSLAAVLECSVEELFAHVKTSAPRSAQWAWTPRAEPCRYWEAEVGRRRLLYPVEALSVNPVPHDGVWATGVCREAGPAPADTTLTLACCDPAAGLLATEYARSSGFRLLVFPRSGGAALDLLRRGLVHVAGLHRSTAAHPRRNAEAVQEQLGGHYRLLHVAEWEEGIALPPDQRTRSANSVVSHPRRWAAREPGSAARECLDELFAGRRFSGRQTDGHAAVAEAVRAGWAQAGVCVRFSADEAGLNFLPVRREMLDFCFSSASLHDPRIQALVRLLRTRNYRRLISELPGYNARHTGELAAVFSDSTETH
jgi:molybdate-binding protein/DNA-binding XRE family transcriptional regulator